MKLAVDEIQLLMVDLQPALIASSRTVAPESLAAAATVLAKAAVILHWPITYAVVPQAATTDALVPGLRAYAEESLTFSRSITSPFGEPAIAGAIARNNRKSIVVSGFSAEVGILQSTLDAIDAGYSVLVPVDAIGSRSARTEMAALREMECAGATATSVRSLLLRLAPDLSCAPGSLILDVLGELKE